MHFLDGYRNALQARERHRHLGPRRVEPQLGTRRRPQGRLVVARQHYQPEPVPRRDGVVARHEAELQLIGQARQHRLRMPDRQRIARVGPGARDDGGCAVRRAVDQQRGDVRGSRERQSHMRRRGARQAARGGERRGLEAATMRAVRRVRQRQRIDARVVAERQQRAARRETQQRAIARAVAAGEVGDGRACRDGHCVSFSSVPSACSTTEPASRSTPLSTPSR